MFEKNFEKHHENLQTLVETYEKSLRENGTCFLEEMSYDHLIEYYEDRQDYQRVLEVVDLAAEQYPFSGTFLVKKAQAHFEIKEFDQALDVLDKAEILDAHDINVYLVRADVHVWNGDFEQAVRTIRGAIEILGADEHPDLFLELADIYEEWEKYDKVVDCLMFALRRSPDNEEALNRMWFCIEFTEDYERSVEFHKELIDESPYSYLAWFNLAHAYTGLQRYEEAIEAFGFVLVINDQFEYAYKDCGEVYFKMKEYQKAADFYMKASLISKPYKELYYSIGKCYECMDNHKRARYYYRKAINIDPYFDEALYKIGRNYQLEGRWENALNSFERAYKLDNNNPAYIESLGLAYIQVENFKEAAIYLRKAIDLNPENQELWIHLAKSLFKAQQYRDALNALDEATEYFDNVADFFYVKSAFYYQIGNLNESFVSLEHALLQNNSAYPMVFDLAPDMKQDAKVTDLVETYNN